MEQERIRAILEALLLAAEDPVPFDRFADVFDGVDEWTVHRALRSLQLEYDGENRGIHLVEVAGGYRLRTNPDLADHVRAFFEAEPVRLSNAAMETLAIVAYRQPLTRAEIEEIRGVNCSGMLKKLREFDLVDVIGQLDDIGQPHLYGTTDRFLEFFGLENLSELPTIDDSELAALVEMHDDFDTETDESDQASEEESDSTGDR